MTFSVNDGLGGEVPCEANRVAISSANCTTQGRRQLSGRSFEIRHAGSCCRRSFVAGGDRTGVGRTQRLQISLCTRKSSCDPRGRRGPVADNTNGGDLLREGDGALSNAYESRNDHERGPRQTTETSPWATNRNTSLMTTAVTVEKGRRDLFDQSSRSVKSWRRPGRSVA